MPRETDLKFINLNALFKRIQADTIDLEHDLALEMDLNRKRYRKITDLHRERDRMHREVYTLREENDELHERLNKLIPDIQVARLTAECMNHERNIHQLQTELDRALEMNRRRNERTGHYRTGWVEALDTASKAVEEADACCHDYQETARSILNHLKQLCR